MNFINKTGLEFTVAQKLTASDLKILNNTINTLVDAVNNLLQGLYDLNIELKNFDRTFSLEEAISIVSNERRIRGMKLRFRNKSGKFVEYSYVGNTLDSIDWNNQNNWLTTLEVIDGGTW